MKEGKEPLRTFGDLMQFYQFQSGGATGTACKEIGERPSAAGRETSRRCRR